MVVVFTQSPCRVESSEKTVTRGRSGVTCLVPRVPLLGECHGGIPFAKHFRNSVHQLGELLAFFGGKILTKARMEAPAGFDLFAGDVGHHTDELDLASCLSSRS